MKFKIIKGIGVIPESTNGNTKEINIIQWGNHPP